MALLGHTWAQTPATIYKTTVVLTDSQIRTVETDYKIISGLPAQIIVPIMCMVKSHIVAAYSNISSDSSIEVWTGNVGNMEFEPLVNDQNQIYALLAPGYAPTDMITYLHPASFFDAKWSSTVPLVPAIQSQGDYEAPLVYHHFNTAGNLTGGDRKNTLTLTVWYALYP